MIVISVDCRDDDILQTLQDCQLFALNHFHDITHIELLSPFLYIDSFVQASVDPDLDHAGDEVSSKAHQEKRST